MWRAYLGDTLSGVVGEPIDVPSVTWSVTVSDCSLSTTRDKGTGGAEASGLQLPWSSVPGVTPEARQRALAPFRRSLFLCWEDGSGSVPVVAGAIGPRVDSFLDTSFELVSMRSLLSQRVVVLEGTFGNGEQAGTTTSELAYRRMSLRGIASEIGFLATSAKPGGDLPIDWSYLGEEGKHQRTYQGFNAHNNDLSKLVEAMTNVIGGPDAQLRPYWVDERTIRHRLLMGTDAHPELDQTGLVRTLTSFPGGGTVENLRVAHTAPVMRVYAHGAGEDKAMLTHLAEDLALAQRRDPWPLLEATVGFPDDESLAVLRSHAEAALAASRRPLAQVTCDMWLDDPAAPSLTEIWPGMVVNLDVEGHPGLPDGTYALRLMEVTGDETPMVSLTFDPILDPWEE